LILLAFLEPPPAGTNIAAKTAITNSNSASMNPLIFALAESVFMID